MIPKFRIQSNIDWSMKLDNSGSYEVRFEMEWLVYCIVLGIVFHSKLTKWPLPQHYDVPQVLDSIRYWLVHEIGQFRFVRSSFWNRVVGVLHSFCHWISLKSHQMPPHTILSCSPSFGQFRFVQNSLWNGVLGVLHSCRDWISLKNNQMTPPTVLWCSPSFGLNPISICPWNWTIQVHTKFVMKWSSWCIA